MRSPHPTLKLCPSACDSNSDGSHCDQKYPFCYHPIILKVDILLPWMFFLSTQLYLSNYFEVMSSQLIYLIFTLQNPPMYIIRYRFLQVVVPAPFVATNANTFIVVFITNGKDGFIIILLKYNWRHPWPSIHNFLNICFYKSLFKSLYWSNKLLPTNTHLFWPLVWGKPATRKVELVIFYLNWPWEKEYSTK